MNLIFYLAGAVAVLATLLAISRLSVVHALLYMIVSLLAVALSFFALGAPFAAVLEVIIYAGAIMVLFVFVVMLLNLGPEAAEQEHAWLRPASWGGPAALATILIAELGYMILQPGQAIPPAQGISPLGVSVTLLGPYLLGVELASFLLLSGLVVAIHAARREPD